MKAGRSFLLHSAINIRLVYGENLVRILLFCFLHHSSNEAERVASFLMICESSFSLVWKISSSVLLLIRRLVLVSFMHCLYGRIYSFISFFVYPMIRCNRNSTWMNVGVGVCGHQKRNSPIRNIFFLHYTLPIQKSSVDGGYIQCWHRPL